MSFCSFVGYKVLLCELQKRINSGFFLLPEEFETEEERTGLDMLDLWRQALDSGTVLGEG